MDIVDLVGWIRFILTRFAKPGQFLLETCVFGLVSPVSSFGLVSWISTDLSCAVNPPVISAFECIDPHHDGWTSCASQERKDAEDEKDDAPWLPLLDKKNLKEFIIPLSTAAFLGITAMNVLSSNLGQDPLAKDAKHKVLRQILVPMPYAMFSLGIAGLTAAMGATRRPGLLGCATGFLLVELVFLVVVGALVSIVHTEGGNKIVWPFTAGIIFALMVIWPMMCAYPQWLRRAFEFITCCCCSKAESPTDTQDKCKTCGGFVVGGKSPNPAAEGAQPCATCGGDANNPRSAPSNAGTASPPHESKIVDAKNPATATPHGSNIV